MLEGARTLKPWKLAALAAVAAVAGTAWIALLIHYGAGYWSAPFLWWMPAPLAAAGTFFVALARAKPQPVASGLIVGIAATAGGAAAFFGYLLIYGTGS